MRRALALIGSSVGRDDISWSQQVDQLDLSRPGLEMVGGLCDVAERLLYLAAEARGESAEAVFELLRAELDGPPELRSP